MMFRRLKASEIEARVQTVTDKGCSILLYKDARVDQKILDETLGCFNWQRSHQLIGDRLYCTVSVWDEKKKQWISKQDVGTESNTEKEKGHVSDSFKRACFNLGIGRELYTAPFIWVTASKIDLKPKGDKYITYDKFVVKSIGYDDEGTINKLVIYNESKKIIVFQMGEPESEEEKAQSEYDKKAAKKITATQLKSIYKVIEEHPDKVTEKGICSFFNLEKLEDMTAEQLQRFIRKINEMEDAK